MNTLALQASQSPVAYQCGSNDDLLAEDLESIAFRRLALSMEASQASFLGWLGEALRSTTIYKMHTKN